MHTALWILQGLLAFAFVGAAMAKLTQPRSKLIANKWTGWAADFTEAQIKLIGLAEIAGAAGLVLPMALGIAPELTRAAAAGLALLMGGAVMTHLRRHEPPMPAGLFAVLAIVIAVGRSL